MFFFHTHCQPSQFFKHCDTLSSLFHFFHSRMNNRLLIQSISKFEPCIFWSISYACFILSTIIYTLGLWTMNGRTYNHPFYLIISIFVEYSLLFAIKNTFPTRKYKPQFQTVFIKHRLYISWVYSYSLVLVLNLKILDHCSMLRSSVMNKR